MTEASLSAEAVKHRHYRIRESRDLDTIDTAAGEEVNEELPAEEEESLQTDTMII